jgi:hypothetical protein
MAARSFFLFQFIRCAGSYLLFFTSAGDDNRTPQEAQNASTPWKTINRFNAFCAVLVPAILFFSAVGKFSMAP